MYAFLYYTLEWLANKGFKSLYSIISGGRKWKFTTGAIDGYCKLSNVNFLFCSIRLFWSKYAN